MAYTNQNSGGQVYWDAEKNQFYTLSSPLLSFATLSNFNIDDSGNRQYRNRQYIGQPNGGTGYNVQPPSTAYTPNAANNAQLSAFGNGISAPQWMHDAYAAKIASMGGNANPPVPYQINQSGFPGIGGKVAPTTGGQ